MNPHQLILRPPEIFIFGGQRPLELSEFQKGYQNGIIILNVELYPPLEQLIMYRSNYIFKFFNLKICLFDVNSLTHVTRTENINYQTYYDKIVKSEV